MESDVLFRIIIVGDSGVGKSCILLRFTDNYFIETHNITIGVEFGSKIIKHNQEMIKM